MIWKFLLVLLVTMIFIIVGYNIDKYVRAKEEANYKEAEGNVDRFTEDENREV